MFEITRIAVIGAGLMGNGISQVAAQVGKYNVTMCDIEQKLVDQGIRIISNNLQKAMAKNLISKSDISETLERIQGTTDLNRAVSNAEFVIEAVTESKNLKKTLLKKIDSFAKDSTIIVSNTSSIRITELATSVGHPENFCGMHFFSPPQIMELVEITKGEYTSNATVQKVVDVAHKFGKETVVLKKDSPGFIVNRVLIPALNEAADLYYTGVAEKEDIDKAIKLGLRWPMGPLLLMDQIGIDTIIAIAEVLGQEINPKFYPSESLKQLKDRGYLGKKTGKGFYDWSR